jgi:hypothetical protein
MFESVASYSIKRACTVGINQGIGVPHFDCGLRSRDRQLNPKFD